MPGDDCPPQLTTGRTVYQFTPWLRTRIKQAAPQALVVAD
jgi:hypothetical protein